MKEFITVAGESVGEYEEKKSRFIAVAVPITCEEDAVSFIDSVKKKNVGARHNVYAFRLVSGTERSSDDGEPSGTGGKPILELLQHNGISNALIVVTRYFGGVLLGVGGLKRAYTAAAASAIDGAVKLSAKEAVKIKIVSEYACFDRLCFIIGEANGEITYKDFSEDVKLVAVIPSEGYESFENEVEELLPMKAKITEKEKILYFFEK
ncbi:MAG: IMPACT family protein [Acutalibacteraceae bacterium]